MTFKIDKVYTKSGDAGETGLVGGSRISKNDPRIEAMGTIDEVNSLLGHAKEALTQETQYLHEVIEYFQQELFDIGAEVATPSDFSYEGMFKTADINITALEKICDHYCKDLPELNSFILPGGSELAARLHLARTSCRKAERRSFELLKDEGFNEKIPKYLNRLSDVLFVLARKVLADVNKEAPLWKKFEDRKLPF